MLRFINICPLVQQGIAQVRRRLLHATGPLRANLNGPTSHILPNTARRAIRPCRLRSPCICALLLRARLS